MKTKTKPKAKSPRKSEVKNKPTLVVFLIDRSGSMAHVKDETIGGFNGYLAKLQSDDDGSIRFSMSQFDSVGHDCMCSAAPLKQVKKLDDESFQPRGGTPLFDAMGKNIQAAATEAGKKYKVLFVTLTDGQENASHEFSLDSIRALISQKEKDDHWTFAYIGMGLEGFKAAQNMSHGTMSASNVMSSSKATAVASYAAFAGKTRDYSKSRRAGGQSVNCMWTSDIK